MTTVETAKSALVAAGFAWVRGEECYAKTFGSGTAVNCVTVSVRERDGRVVISDGAFPRRVTLAEIVELAPTLAPAEVQS